MDNNQLGKNLQHLRVIRGETLEVIGENLGFARSTIKQYENGSRKPAPETLKRLAKYFGKTVDELLYEDLTVLKKFQTSLVSTSEIVDTYNRIMPLFSTQELMKNRNFSKAFNLCQKVLESFAKGENLRGSIITDIFDAFIHSLEEMESQETIADLLWCIYLWWGQLFDAKDMLLLQNKIISKKLDFVEVIHVQQNESKEVKEKKKEFIADFDILINDAIKVLKSDVVWSDLGDYYLALRYILGVIETGYSLEMNLAIGIQLMLSYAQLENKYAVNFFVTMAK